MKIIVFTQNVPKVSGLKTFEKHLCEVFSDRHKIQYVFNSEDLDLTSLDFPNKVEVTKNEGQEFEADICIYSSIKHGTVEPNIKAKKYIQIVHSDLTASEIQYEKKGKIDYYVAVGKSVQESLKKNYKIDSIVIQNMLPNLVRKKVLRLVTSTRIAQQKGFDRMVQLAWRLRKANIPFVWEIYGDGNHSDKENIKYKLAGLENDIKLMGSRNDVHNYYRGADYLVQLSDHEGYCYSVHEAIQMGIPCIVTKWNGVEDIIKDGKNGFILEMDLSNLNVTEIYNKKFGNIVWRQNDSYKKWDDLFNLIKKI